MNTTGMVGEVISSEVKMESTKIETPIVWELDSETGARNQGFRAIFSGDWVSMRSLKDLYEEESWIYFIH